MTKLSTKGVQVEWDFVNYTEKRLKNKQICDSVITEIHLMCISKKASQPNSAVCMWSSEG